ncbi:MAG: metal ABC transporter permease [Planctomycetota bacterium]|jgi:manganese/zinc/iron transport system permease protein
MDATLLTVMAGAAILGAVAGSLGSFAVLKRRSLLGDALAHAALPGVCLAYLVGRAAGFDPKHPVLLLGGALFTAWIGTLVVLAITRSTRIKQDAAIGIVLSVFFGAGIVLLTHIQHGAGGSDQAGLNSFLFGQAAALSPRDVLIMAVLGATAISLQIVFFRPFQALTFDAEHSASVGLRVRRTDVLLTSLVVVAVVVGLQTVGVVLMAAMLVAPAAAARQWTDRLSHMVLLAGAIGIAAGVLGAWLSSLQERLPTGPLIVLSATALLLLSLAFAPGRGLAWAFLRRVRNRRRIRVENLLKDFWRLGEADGRFRATRAVADVLAVRMASERAVGDARSDGLLAVRGSAAHLTEAGLLRASQVVRNHRIWETYLSNSLHLAEDHVHRDAENMEHALQGEVLEQIDEALGRPAVDPHGRPIPRGVPGKDEAA